MANLIETVNRFRKIEEATAPKDDPAPVYLLDEIADIARQTPESAQAIADAVQKKLGVKSPVVKFKALRIIKHLCTKGCSQFQRCMQRHSASVRELMHWRGEPDPFKGDVPNARVREFAKEVVEVMFNSTPVTNTNNTLAAQGRIQGFGSGGAADISSTYSGIGSSSSGRYGGFSSSGSGSLQGSLAVAQQAASQLTKSAQQALGEGPIAQGIASAANALGGFLQPQGYGSRLNDTPYRDNGYSNGGADYGYSGSSSYAAPAVTPSQVLGSEDALVDDITAPGGLRALPDAADLRRFVDTASSMDGLRIAELLRGKMESSRWQVALRSLAALEAILQRGSTQACGEVAVMFQSDPEPVRKCLQSQQQQVQQLAAAVLKLLLGEDVQVPTAAAAAAGGGGGAGKKAAGAGKAAAAPVADLLVDESPAAPPSSSSSAAAGGIDLLGDLMGPEPAAAAAAPAAAASSTADALLDGLGVTSAAASAPAAAGGDDLFGGLTVAAGAAATTAAPAVAVAPTSAAGVAPTTPKASTAPLDELFAGLSTSNTSNLLGITSPIQLQPLPPLQQQQLGLQQAGLQQQQQQQQLGGLLGQRDLLGGLNSPVKQTGFGLQQLQANGVQQQQQYGIPQPGFGIPQQQQQQQQWGLPLQSGGSALGAVASSNLGQQRLHHQLSGGLAAGHGSGSGSGAMGSAGWKSHNTASEAAFDFVFDEFTKH